MQVTELSCERRYEANYFSTSNYCGLFGFSSG